ncbi:MULTISPECIES: tetratricopeptide repeat protein [unclassified Sporolactobacillus]|uniref:tetratricopeptide repeat protein n=1 Tax=unclassified Sporolactobacillus TaxID=2628533 RepID=UPI002368457E|nr:tetratricopeptide repeat protein [Sporolactobacillus sp. CQH2019]MDD9148669.1 tetratricopeptide repeat protein [Sporolactobacillus sp. CQH2019]
MNHLETANALLASGQTDEGLRLLEDTLRDADDETIYGAASIYQQFGFLEEAEHAYETLLRRYPNDSGLLLQISDLLIDKNEENRAIEYLLKIHPLDENYLSAQVSLADLYQMEGLDEVAEKKLLGALKIAPHEPVLLLSLGEFYLSTGQARKAVDFLEAAKGKSELADQNVELKLAEALSLCGEFERSVKAYRIGLKKEKTLDGLFGYAVTATRIGYFKTAIKALEELRDLDPGYSTLYPVLAHAYEHEGSLDLALKTVEEGLEADEYNDRLYEEAGKLALKIHHSEKAAYYFKKWHEHDPENVEAVTRMAELDAQNEDYEAIIDLLAPVKPDDPMLIWFLATAYFRTDQLDQAGTYYDSCRPAFQDNPEFLQEYGEYLIETGKRKDALSVLEKAARLSPENQDLVLFVERLKQDDQN